MPQITPNLWFDTEALEAAGYYCSIFPNSGIKDVTHYTEVGPREAGLVLTVDFYLDGQPYTAINGGPEFPFTEAVSFLINCHGQDEVDHYWDKLLADGGEPIQCGWLKDKYGLAWQVVPEGINDLVFNPDPEKAKRAMACMMKQVKLDIAEIEKAADGK